MTKDEIFDKIDDVYSEHDGGVIYLSDERTERLKEIIQQAINFIPCCETLKDEKTPTIEVNLNTKESAYKRCNDITKVLKAPSRIFLYDGEKYIELKP